MHIPDKIFFKIGEVAKLLNENPSAIRHWEKEFRALRPKKTTSGSRLYTQKDVHLLLKIKHLVRERGLTIEGARKIIDNKEPAEDHSISLRDTLVEIRHFLVRLRDELE